MDKPKLINYKNVKRYLFAVIIFGAASQFASVVSIFMSTDDILKQRSTEHINFADIVSWVAQVIFFIFLALLLLQVAEYYNKKK